MEPDMSLDIGDPAPDFSLPKAGGGTITLAELRGEQVIVFFYPKADTPGCTKEACGFSEQLPDFTSAGARIIGISKDPVSRLEKFAGKYGLDVVLASDAESDVVESYGSWIEKMNYGRSYMGIDRSTFLIGPDGRIKALWRKVRVPGHVEAVLAAARG